ncbi:MAG: ATP phosphoribosyltransferase [Tissierellia bacterium]|nr:ATP phosphoribosyltransferase [Tissierellia bacterium]
MNYEITGSRTIFGDEVKRMREITNVLINESEKSGFEEIMIPNFEDYDLYKNHRGIDRLQMVKTIDNDGRVIVLRPDATIGITRFVSKNFPIPESPVKLFYISTIFREFKGVKKVGRDFIQGGVEFFGVPGIECEAEVIKLAISIIRNLNINNIQIGLGSAEYLSGFLSTLNLDREDEDTIMEFLEGRDLSGLIPFLESRGLSAEDIDAFIELTSMVGESKKVLPRAIELIRNEKMKSALNRLEDLSDMIREIDSKICIKLDFTLTKRFNYYTDTIFELYAGGMHVPVVSGGRYDKLAAEFGAERPAVGFGMNLSLLLDFNENNAEDIVTVAIAKGRFTDEVVRVLSEGGLDFPDYHKETRKLLFKDSENKYKLIFVKSPDVPTYVESGAADLGIVGSDILDEGDFDGYILKTTGIGKCRMSFAKLKESNIPKGSITVASKYPRIAADYLKNQGVSANLIKLNGSVELGPIVGLSDLIVDIVESGKTLKENGLEEMESFKDISSKVICNKVSFKTKQEYIEKFLELLKDI